MTKEELILTAYQMTGGIVSEMTTEKIKRLITVSQYITDLCLNELEQRHAITFDEGEPIIPYVADHHVETVLTRDSTKRYHQ